MPGQPGHLTLLHPFEVTQPSGSASPVVEPRGALVEGGTPEVSSADLRNVIDQLNISNVIHVQHNTDTLNTLVAEFQLFPGATIPNGSSGVFLPFSNAEDLPFAIDPDLYTVSVTPLQDMGTTRWWINQKTATQIELKTNVAVVGAKKFDVIVRMVGPQTGGGIV